MISIKNPTFLNMTVMGGELTIEFARPEDNILVKSEIREPVIFNGIKVSPNDLEKIFYIIDGYLDGAFKVYDKEGGEI